MRLSFSRGGGRWRQSGPPHTVPKPGAPSERGLTGRSAAAPPPARAPDSQRGRLADRGWSGVGWDGVRVGLTPGHVPPCPPHYFTRGPHPPTPGSPIGGVRPCPPPLRVTPPPEMSPPGPDLSPHSPCTPVWRSPLCDQLTHRVLIVLRFLFLNPSHLSELQLHGPVVLIA